LSQWPHIEDVTADCMYLRLHGEKARAASGYSDDALDWRAQRIRACSPAFSRDVFC
jgi:uncharacterized protein YecE (DUF72 family)